MKRFAAILLVAASVLLLAGCSFSLYRREDESRDIYKKYIEVGTDDSASYTEKVAAEAGAAVVSVIAHTIVRTNRGTATVAQVFSGVIINADGYVLSTSNAAYLSVTDGNHVYSNEVMSAYAVLPEVYDDDSHYKLTLIDYDTDVGLALFRF